MKKPDIQEDAEEFKEERIEEEGKEVIEIDRLREDLQKDINLQIEQKFKGVDKDKLISVTQDINETLKSISEIDSLINDILNNRDEVSNYIMRLENQNRLFEAKEVRMLLISKFYRIMENFLPRLKILRSQYGQLQNKIRTA